MTPEGQPLNTCTSEYMESAGYHALVYGKVRIWYKDLSDNDKMDFRWSKTCWWKAMWYPHRGEPSRSHTWGVYAGCSGYTGPGDAELTFWLPMPPEPCQKKD